MFYKVYKPSSPLRPYIHCFWILDVQEYGFALSPKFPPIGNNGLIFNYGSFKCVATYRNLEYVSSRVSLCGLFTKHYAINISGKGGLLGILFKPGVLHHAFKINMNEIKDNEFDGEDLMGPEITRLLYRIQEAYTPGLKIKQVETYLTGKFNSIKFDFGYTKDFIGFINERKGNLKMKDIKDYFKLSLRTIEKKFKMDIGIPPKKYSAIVQFNSILEDLNDSRLIDWCGLADKAGYYDQQHLINAFVKNVGLPPNKYIGQDNTYNEFYLLKK